MLSHNEMVGLTGRCGCECHTPAGTACWCGASPRLTLSFAPTYRLNHNDAVRFLGRCPSPHHVGCGAVLCDVRTDPRLLAGLQRRESDARRERVGRGVIRNGADMTLAMKMGVLPPGRRR